MKMNNVYLLALLAVLAPTGLRAAEVLPAGQSIEALGAHRFDAGSVQRGVTLVIMESFSRALRNYAIDHERFPEGDIPKLVTILVANKVFYVDDQLSNEPQRKPNEAIFLNPKGQLIDGWGTPLILERTSNGRILTLISHGPDRKLNQTETEKLHRLGDDIYVTIDL